MAKIDPKEIQIKLMRKEDLSSVIEIDKKVGKIERPEYYRIKFIRALDSNNLITSLVAEYKGKVVGFLMGEVQQGEFGIPENTAMIDTIGINPEFQKSGIASLLFNEFLTIMKGAGVKSIQTIVNWDSIDIIKFFSSNGFSTSKSIVLERKI